MTRKIEILLLAAALGLSQSTAANPAYSWASVQRAFIVSSDARFDPMVQRLLAQNALRAMPIGNDAMLFVIPDNGDVILQESQIRYLDELMQRHIEPDRHSP